MVRRVVAIAVVGMAALALAGSGFAEEKNPKQGPLPREDSVDWDVSAFEDAAAFKVVKREVKGGQVVWVLENRGDQRIGHLYTFVAEFLDEDGVKLTAVQVQCEQIPANLKDGERNRFVLDVPRGEKWKNARKVVIKSN